MIVAAAVCPHPPLLVPELAAGAAGELEPLRAACTVAIRAMLELRPDVVAVVGVVATAGTFGAGEIGTLAPYGVPVRVTLGQVAGSGPPTLPLAHTIGAWLLHRVGWAGGCEGIGVPAAATDAELAEQAAKLSARAERLALLVMGDGSARRCVRGPGFLDPRATGFDATIVRALADADGATLRGLDQRLAGELLCAGAASWRLLGHALRAGLGSGSVLYDDAPYGVEYVVASLLPAGRPA